MFASVSAPDNVFDVSRYTSLSTPSYGYSIFAFATQLRVWFAGMDRETGKPRGFAHVQFEGVEGAAAAIAKNGTELMGRDLFIDSAQERPQSGPTPGRQQRGGVPSDVSVTHALNLLSSSRLEAHATVLTLFAFPSSHIHRAILD